MPQPTTEESREIDFQEWYRDKKPYRAEREALTHSSELTSDERFALKAKGALGEVANYLWSSVTDIPSRLERNYRSNEDYLGKMLAYTGVQIDRLLEIPRAVGRISEAYDKGEDYRAGDVTSVMLALLASGPARGEFRLAGKAGSAIRQKWKLKEEVTRQMTTKNPGYKFGAKPRPLSINAPIEIEASTQAVLRAIDKLPDEEFRQLQKFDMLNEAEYAKETAKQGSFGGFYEYSMLNDANRIAIPYREPAKNLSVHVTHEVTHGTIRGAMYRPVKGAPFPPKSQQGNRSISVEDKTLFRSVEVNSPRSVPYEDRPVEITSRITANIVKALPSKMFKGGKIPQTVFDGIVRGAAEASLKAGKPIGSASTIKGTKGWKFIPEGNKSPFIMTKGTKGSETKIAEKMDSAGNMYYEIYLDELKLPDKFTDLESVVKEANSYTDIIGFGG